MVINAYTIISIIGLICIILGTFLISLSGRTKRQIIYPFLLIGGICLLFYSIHIKDPIFTILQAAYAWIVIYDIIKLIYSKDKSKKKKR